MSKPETFDQFYGLSQIAVNDYLRELFRLQPELAQLNYTDSHSKAQMTGTLHSPTVVFQVDEGTQELKIYFETRIAAGSIYFSETTSQDLAGWVITAWATLVNPTVTSKAKAGDYSTLNPGDYSIRRLLSTFSAQGWTAPDYDVSSYRKADGTMASLLAWSKDPKNSKVATPLKNVLRRWAIAHQDNPFFSIKPKELPSDTPIDSTSVPTALHLQFAKYNGTAGGVIPPEQVSDPYNCFVFCENCNNNPLPKEKKLIFTGTLAGPADGARAKLNGTSVLHHTNFLTKQLLPKLEPLCAMSRLVPLMPKSFVDSSQQYILQPGFYIGGDPSTGNDPNDLELSNQLQSDPGFDFEYSTERKYAWTRGFAAPGSQTELCTYNAEYAGQLFRRYRIESQSKVTVTWDSGSDFLKLESFSEYYHWDGWRKKDSDFTCERNNDSLSQIFQNKISWSVNIRLLTSHTKIGIPSGMIIPEIDGSSISSGLPIDFKATASDGCVESITSSIASILKENLERFSKWLREAGAFVYPGANQLAFGPIHLDDSGAIISSCDWRQPQNDNLTLYPLKERSEPFKFLDTSQNMAPLPVKRNFPLLTWHLSTKKYDPNTGEIWLRLFPYYNPEKSRNFTSLKMRVGLPGSQTTLANASFRDPPESYDDEDAHVVHSIDKDGVVRAAVLPKSGHDSFDVPSDDVKVLIDPIGTLMKGPEPFVVRVDEEWDCKDANGNQLGLYATQHFQVSLKPNSGNEPADYVPEIPWLDAEHMMHVA